MSLLAPLYFFGALAVGLPILFHLIRRRPKGEVEFSSLMFLRPTPPRLTRKSRLENLPLLLIRALALILLAAAFARPFLRSTVLSDADLPIRRIILVIDTSASMQRAGLWQQAVDQAGDVIDDLRAGDQFAIVSFDATPRLVLGFEQSERLELPQLKSTAVGLVKELQPTWHQTETGQAIAFAADLAVAYEPDDKVGRGEEDETSSNQLTGPVQMVLVSDMQIGSHIESLQVYAWPDQLRMEVKQTIAADKTNATAQLLPGIQLESADKDRVRVRVSNSSDATDSHFQLSWQRSAADIASNTTDELPIQVPPGESRVVRMPKPLPGVTALLLSGDDHSFDNTRYLVSPRPQALTLLHLGATSDEPRESLLYYLQRVPLDNPRRTVQVESIRAAELTTAPDPETSPLIVVEEPFSADVGERLSQYIDAGGHLLYVLAGREQLEQAAASLSGLIVSDRGVAEQLRISEAEVRDYAMLARIDFQHAIFAPMADPQFNDFSKIRIWSHRQLDGLDESWSVLASFDDASPAFVQRDIGQGSLRILATGWQPSQSQLALSTKFIPLIFSLFDSSGGQGESDSYVIGDSIDMVPSASATISGPENTSFDFRHNDDLAALDRPGIYQFDDGDQQRSFAVNLHESESRTAALGDTELERFGVKLGKHLSTAQSLAQQRQLRDIELEGRQRLWQWLLIAALGLLAAETLLSGWLSRRRLETIQSGLQS